MISERLVRVICPINFASKAKANICINLHRFIALSPIAPRSAPSSPPHRPHHGGPGQPGHGGPHPHHQPDAGRLHQPGRAHGHRPAPDCRGGRPVRGKVLRVGELCRKVSVFASRYKGSLMGGPGQLTWIDRGLSTI